MKMSQAFASERQAVIAECLHKVVQENVPSFNAECEDIRRQHEEQSKDLKIGEALADYRKRARVNHLVMKRANFIKSLETVLHKRQEERIKEYEGVIETEMDGDKEVIVAKFPDGSKAKVAKQLWIDYKNLYQRV